MLKGKTVLLGVTGSIAAYKIAYLASALKKLHAQVHVLMTKNATNFINPITFETLTGNKCLVDTFDRNFQFSVEHVSIAKQADVVMIAPASANVIGKLAHGIADDMLTTTIMACKCKKIVSPAMNTNMYENPIVQDNLAILQHYGYEVIEPASGYLACGDTGAGKMPEPEMLLDYILREIAKEKDLLGRKVLVTAGPTQESIDPVRYITNHSSGKMGYALAKAAMLRGADVTLVSGPCAIEPPPFVKLVPVVTAKEMFDAVTSVSFEQDIIIKAACYGNEHQIGEVFKTAFDEGVVERKDLFIMTKVWNDMHRKVEEACTKSIQDLQCDYVDLYFIHWPFPNYHAPFCDVDSRNPDSRPFSVEEFMDTYRQCEELVEKGKIRYIGISNMTIPKLEAVLPLMKIKPAACELELHPCFQQQEQYDYLVAHNIQPVGYMPLGSPRRPERDICPEDVADMQTPEMQEIAKAHGVHPALIALKWAHQRGEISIPFSVHNYVSNLKCVTEDPLTEEEMAKIGTLERGNRLVKGQVFLWEGAKDWHDLWDEEGFIVK